MTAVCTYMYTTSKRDSEVSHDLHNSSNVVSDIVRPLLNPPKNMTSLKSGPVPNWTAECPYRPVISVGSDSCNENEK